MANNPYKLENMLISSSAHFRSLELKAKFKATKDLHFKGLPDDYFIDSMTRMQGNRYLMTVANCDAVRGEVYCVDVNTMTAERLELNVDNINNSFVDGEYMLLVVSFDDQMIILRDLVEIGQIEFAAKYEYCKSGNEIRGRYAQQAGHSVYAVDDGARLYRIEWQDIKDGKYVKTLVKEKVENFYVDGRLGLATLSTNNVLSSPSGTDVDLKAKVDSKATWTIVACIAKCWIVCGDRDHETDGHAIMTSVNDKGDVRSTLTLKLTSNGYVNDEGIKFKFASIYSLHNVFTRGRRGIMLAIERDGCCHLISVVYGRLSKLQSTNSIVNVNVVEDKRYRIVTSLTATGTKGEFIAGGIGWTKRIILKLK